MNRGVHPVRAAWASLLLVAGCFQPSSQALGDDTDHGPNGGSAAECAVDVDCTGGGASCCECPSFAQSRASGWDDSCEDVTCQAPPTCSAAPACDQGQCVLRCAEVVCDLECAGGFVADDLGCLTCACSASPLPPSECQVDADCVRVPADCCGCELGGADTAVPASGADTFTDGLGCSGNGTCPGVDVCDPALVPRCLAGACALSGPPTTDPTDPPDAGSGAEADQYCGTPDLPPCPVGQQCVLNDPAAMEASQAGLGVCRTP